MAREPLLRCIFTGTCLEPDGAIAAAALADKFGAGEVVSIDIDPDRSPRSHNHQFAFVHQAWLNLPESHQGRLYAASSDHLRKHALIKCGYHHADMIALGDPRRAERVAVTLARQSERDEVYRIITVEGAVIYSFTAETQKMKAMGKTRFQQSKQDILEFLADMIGVKPDELAKMGRKGTA
ncbi:hypothetical protein KU6B_48140 [Mameliella alba]|uniref:hypothetical protein n=1 Tax=Mameliella alba TaxID=561184 RepID=UPI0013E50667|nr:hypothetical protein [Mameliella alba]BBU58549.1 hypothetical protein KU6B_48140 [Mameliella alba]